jgi:hypothetical protein
MPEPMKINNAIAVASNGQFKGFLRATGGLRLGTTMTGINITTGAIKSRHVGLLAVTAGAFATASNGPVFSQSAAPFRGDHAAASGTVLAGWHFFYPRTVTIRQLSIGFVTGPRGGIFGIKIFSRTGAGTNTSKGVVTFPVLGNSKAHVNKSGLTITMPANSLLAIAVHTIGATVAGGGGMPYTHHTNR